MGALDQLKSSVDPARAEELRREAVAAAAMSAVKPKQDMQPAADRPKGSKKDTPPAPRTGGDATVNLQVKDVSSVPHDALLRHLEDISKDPQMTIRGAGRSIADAIKSGASEQEAQRAVEGVEALVNLHFALSQKQTSSQTQTEQNIITVLGACVGHLQKSVERYRSRPAAGFVLLADPNGLVDSAFVAELSNIDLTK